MKRLGIAAACVVVGLVATPSWAQPDQHDHGSGGSAIKAGTVSFENSCSPAVKDEFNLAVAELHSFWFPESRAIFESVAKKDPTCAIAFWGVALTFVKRM